MRCYPILMDYVGPEPHEHIHEDRIEIMAEPGRTVDGGDVKTDGWLGVRDGWSLHALGEFPDRIGALERIVADYNVRSGMMDAAESFDVVYFVNHYDWLHETITDWVDAETTDCEIDELAEAACHPEAFDGRSRHGLPIFIRRARNYRDGRIAKATINQ